MCSVRVGHNDVRVRVVVTEDAADCVVPDFDLREAEWVYVIERIIIDIGIDVFVSVVESVNGMLAIGSLRARCVAK